MSKFSAVVEAWALLWACRVGLWVAPFPQVLRGAEFCAARRSRRPVDPLRALSAIHFALPLTVRASCLTQALAGWVMLTRHGVASRVRIGVSSHEKHGFKAHAWMEVGGVVLLGDD
ncbi:MAG: lasso peptide biosynthesis B2 protein, partial [Acidobacteriaceae bacterium]